MGEVMEHEGPDGKDGPPRVEGLAVDTAARIQSLALPGQILMNKRRIQQRKATFERLAD